MADQTGLGEEDKDLPSHLPGTVIGGKYRIDGMIGRGGMGSVWSAMHLGLNQRVAVKLIAKRYASSREARQRFDVEAKAAAQLRSRFVVQVYDNGMTDDGTPFIVMELLEGESLDQRIQQKGPVPVDQSVRILSQVGRALGRAHSLGIVHRDLKPENIFLSHTEDDEGEVAKVLDFGIAKIRTPENADSATRTGTVLGTPLFMSPEQARGLKSVDHRTDVYSLGMVAYMMWTGQPAFSGESFGDILVAICTQPLPSLQRGAPWLPPGLDAWLGRACAREPENRYASVEELLEGLYGVTGVGRPNLQSQELVSGGSSGVGRSGQPAAAREVSARTQVASTGGEGPVHATTAAVSVTGEDIAKRSVLLPIAFVSVFVAVGAAAAFAFMRKPGDARGNGAPPASISTEITAAAPPIHSAAPAAPSGSTAGSEKAGEDGGQKSAIAAKPSGKLALEPVKSASKPAEVKPVPQPRPRSTTDLGF